MSRIIVVEDDPAVRGVVKHALGREEGMYTLTVEDGETALERLTSSDPFDLVILDVMLPGVDGISVCRQIRRDDTHGDVPVLMLSARDDETSVVTGLEVGADDYITKPFRPRELVSRVRVHLRRRRLYSSPTSEEHKQWLEFPGLKLDRLRREVISEGEPVSLTASEFEVLALLASHPGQVFSREQIMRHVWDGKFYGDGRVANVHVQHIREKIEPDPHNPRYLKTVHGVGYKFARDLRGGEGPGGTS